MVHITCYKFSERRIVVDLLVISFGIGSWVAINGLWVELPLLVNTLPEGWNLPSYLAIIIQVANIGPIVYSIIHRMFPNKVHEAPVVYGILTLGAAASLLLAFFWKDTMHMFGQEHSISLIILVFFLSIVDCTSSVLFLPYMAIFKEMYLTSYLIGEGLSGFLPSIVALIQGSGGNPHCQNVTYVNVTEFGNVTESKLVPVPPVPRFSVDIFFFFLFAMMTVSELSFLLLNKLNVAQMETVCSKSPSSNEYITGHYNEGNSMQRENTVAECKCKNLSSNFQETQPAHDCIVCRSDNQLVLTSSDALIPKPLSQSLYFYLLFIQAWICALSNGVFPSIQSFSSLPYGNVAYHLAVTLSSMANPLACFIGFFLPTKRVGAVTGLMILGTAISIYIMATARMSPEPPYVGTTIGEALVVLSWILFTGLFTYVKVSVASIFRLVGRQALFWCGVVTQAGSASGALIMFLIVNNTNLFKSYNPCS